MNFLLVYSGPGILGGIETLILRMSRWLAKSGHHVTLLVESSEQWSDNLPPEVRCIALGKRFPELYYYFHARRLWKTLAIPRPDVIKSFDIGSSWIACQLAALTGGNAKVIAGIYNPYVFSWYYDIKSAAFWEANKVYVGNFVENIPARNRIFCSAEQIEEFNQVHHQSGHLWPIPIATSEFEPATRCAKWGKIVSVGRLSPMKEYNLYMVDVVRDLVERGHNVTWSVYGTGEYEGPMREAIRRHGLEQVISMEGMLPYKRFRQALEDAYVFVGMGTTILEASLFKVPNITAVAYDREGLTWGPVYRIPQGSLGPTSDVPPRLKVTDEIERILRLQPSEYAAEQELVYRHVQVHAMDASMQRFLELAQNAVAIKSRKSIYLANYPFWFIRRLVRRRQESSPVQHPPGLLVPGTLRKS